MENTTKKQQRVDINKRPAMYKLICANYNKDETKIGLHVLDYSASLENGHLDNPSIKTFWLDITEHPQAVQLVKFKLYSDFACIVSGTEEYTRFHKLLTKEAYKALLETFN